MSKIRTDYDGPFMVGGTYYEDMHEYLDDCDGNGLTPAEYIFVPKRAAIIQVDITNLLLDSNWVMRENEDGLNAYNGVKDFKEAIDKFNAANSENYVYWEGSKEKVKVPKDE